MLVRHWKQVCSVVYNQQVGNLSLRKHELNSVKCLDPFSQRRMPERATGLRISPPATPAMLTYRSLCFTHVALLGSRRPKTAYQHLLSCVAERSQGWKCPVTFIQGTKSCVWKLLKVTSWNQGTCCGHTWQLNLVIKFDILHIRLEFQSKTS